MATPANTIKKDKTIVVSPFGIFVTLCAIIVVLNSGYYRFVTQDSLLPLFLLITATALCLLLLRGNIFTADVSTVFLLLIAGGILLSIFFNFSTPNILSGGRVLVTALCCYVMIKKIGIEPFFKQYSCLMRIIIWLTVALWLYMTLTNSLPGNVFAGEYYDLFVVTAQGVGGRMMGLFWEPGVFASMVIMTMLVELYFLQTKPSGYRLFLYSFGVLLSGSTAGILILIILLVSYLWRHWDLERYWIANLAFVMFVVLGIVYYERIFEFLFELNPEIFEKLLDTSAGTTATRLNGPLANLTIFIRRPLTGYGFTDAATMFTQYMGLEGEWNIVAQTSTSTQIMAAIGILGLAYTAAFLYPLFAGKKRMGLGIVSRFAIAAIMLLIVNKEPHLHIATTWIVMFVVLSARRCVISK